MKEYFLTFSCCRSIQYQMLDLYMSLYMKASHSKKKYVKPTNAILLTDNSVYW